MDYRLAKKRISFFLLVLVISSFFSCQKPGDRIKDCINKGEFNKAENLISAGTFSDVEKKAFFDLLFTKKVDAMKQAVYDSDWDFVTGVLQTSSFSDKQFDIILTGLYKACPDIEKLYINTGFNIPVTAKCENINILQKAIDEKNGKFLSQLMNEKSLKGICLSKVFIQELLKFNDTESLGVYFSDKECRDFFLTLPDSLELICFYPCLFNFFSENEFLRLDGYDRDFKYFQVVLDALNVKALKLLIELSIPMNKSDYEYYLYFISSSFTNGDIQWFGVETEEYEEIVSMKNEIQNYFNNQK